MALNGPLGLGLVFQAKDLATGVMGRVRNGFAQTRNEMGQFGMRSKEVFASFATGAKAMGLGLAGLGLFAATVPAAAAFSGRIAEISTLTDEASLNTGFLSAEVLKLNAAYGGGTAAQAKALYDGISAGAGDAASATALLTSSNKLAVGGVTEVNVALDGLTSSLNAYGESFTKAGDYSDAFFVAVQKGKTTVGELSAVVGGVAPTAAALGIGFDDLAASIAAVTTKGLKTAEAATGIKAALANIIKPTSDATAEAARLGIKFTAAAVRAKGFPALLQRITSSAKFNKDSLSKLFSSVEGLNAALALTANDSKTFKDTLDAMKGKAGAADKAFEKMSATLAFQGKRFAGLAENAKIMVGQALEPLAAKIVGFANDLLEAFGKIPKPIRDYVVQAAAAASATVALIGAVASGRALFMAVAAAARMFGLSAGAGIVSALGPAILIIGVVGAALYAFKRAVDLNLGGVGDAFAGFKDGVTQTWDALGQLFTQGGFSGALRDEFLKGNNAFVNFAVKIYLIANRVKNFFAGIWDGLTSAVDAIDFSGLTSAFDGLMDLFGGVKNDAGAAGNAFEMFGKAGQIVGGVIGKVAGVVTSVLAAAINVVAGFAEGWDQWVSPALDFASEALGAVYDAIAETVSGLGDALGVGGDTGDLFRTIGMVLANVFGGALKIVSSVVKFAASNLKALGQVVAGVVKVVVSVLKGDWAGAWEGAKGIVGGLIDYVIGGFGGMLTVVADAIDAIAGLAGVDLGLGKRMEAFTVKAKKWAHEVTGTGETVTPKAAAPVASTTPSMSPAVAAVPPPGVSPEQLFGSIASMKAAKPQVTVQPMVAPVVLNGEKVGEIILKAQQNAAVASFQPVPLSSEG